MENSEAQKEIIDLLIQNESEMGELYRGYAKSFCRLENSGLKSTRTSKVIRSG